MATTYEWGREILDDAGDVIDQEHAAKLSELEKPDGPHVCLVLVRNVGEEINGLEDRQWACVENGSLPDAFDGGAKVPGGFMKKSKNTFDTYGFPHY